MVRWDDRPVSRDDTDCAACGVPFDTPGHRRASDDLSSDDPAFGLCLDCAMGLERSGEVDARDHVEALPEEPWV